MKNRLVTPLLALATGIGLARFISFRLSDFLWTLPILFGLTCLAWRCSSGTLRVCCSLVFVFCGALLSVLHRPGSAPTIDATARESVLLDGCVVSPPAFSENGSDQRDQFVLELAPKARARVSLALPDGASAPDLQYGQLVDSRPGFAASAIFKTRASSITKHSPPAALFTGQPVLPALRQ